MLVILLKSSACLAIFMLFYKLCLEKTSAHTFKRFYLISVLLISIGIPFITFTEYIEVTPQILPQYILEFSNDINTTIEPQQTNYLPIILWSIYGLGVLLFSLKFLKNLAGIIIKIKHNPKYKNNHFINVLLQDLIVPHTFFNYIFLNKHKFETQQIPKEVLLHEETHAKQKHSLDVLFIEILQILFWFNPLIYFIKHSIKLNHEFLADQAVINKGITPSAYQKTLLAFSSNASEPQLANAINYSSIKKRFTVMKTQTSKTALWFRSLIILPLLAILIYSFSEKSVIEEEIASFESLTIQETDKGATETMMKEYIEFINEVEKSNTIWAPKLNRAKAIYDIMTEAQRTTVKKLPKTPLSNLATVKPKTVTEFNSWKNSNKFAVWIDGKNVDNTILKNHKASDFKYYTSSFVYNNARSEKFPQPYQNHLYTKKGFEESYLKRNVNDYNNLKNQYLKVEKEFNNSNNKDNSELRILEAKLDKTYNSLSKEDIEKYSVEKEAVIHENSTTKTKKYQIEILINKEERILIENNIVSIEKLKNHLNNLDLNLTKKERKKLVSVKILCENSVSQNLIKQAMNLVKEYGVSKIHLYKHEINIDSYLEKHNDVLYGYKSILKEIENTTDFKHKKKLYIRLSAFYDKLSNLQKNTVKSPNTIFESLQQSTLKQITEHNKLAKKLILNPEKPINASENHQIKVFINEDRQIFVDNIKVDFNYLSQKIIEIKNQLIATKYANERDYFKIKYNLFIKVEIKGHATEQYLDDIKSEIEKSNLTISSITADSVFLNKKGNNDGMRKKINVTSTKDTIYKYRQTTKITIDTISKSVRNKKP